jgi:Predicted membrane protein
MLREKTEDFFCMAASFIIPAVVMIFAYDSFGISLDGTKTVLISDMKGQYIDFYSALYDIFKNSGSLLYSWKAGMGLNFVGIFTYYLSSPFSLLIVLFNKEQLTQAVYWMTILKIGASGLTFSIYLRYICRKERILICIFSVLYGLMSYNVVYSFNIMWLDGVIFLPLVLLGVEKCLRENKILLLYICFFVSFIANFYISYMVGLFSFLYFLAVYFSNHPVTDIRAFMSKLFIFFLCAVLAAGSSAFLMLPTFYALKNGMGISGVSLSCLDLNFKAFDLLSKLPAGAYDTLTNGLPNIYCGLFPIVAVPLFFLNKKINIRERVLFFSLLIILFFSFIFYNLNLIWHAFDAPNWFPYRYSFLFSFLVLSLSFKGLTGMDGSNLNIVFKSYGVCLFVIILLQKFEYVYLPGETTALNILLLTLYLVILIILFRYNNGRKIILFILLLLAMSEARYNAGQLISGMDKEFKYEKAENYNTYISGIDVLIKKVQERDNGFYRMERTRENIRSFNDSMNLNYNGISHFSSMINENLNGFLKKLGFMTPVIASVDYSGSTVLTGSMLGVKYVISQKDQGFGYNEILKNGSLKVYENKYALPIGYLANTGLLNLNAKVSNPFVLQNDLLNLSVERGGENYINYFSRMNTGKIYMENAFFSYMNGKQGYCKIDTGRDAYVEFDIGNGMDQQVYMYLPEDEYSCVDVYVNGSYIDNYLHFYNNKILNLGYYSKDNDIKVRLAMKTDSFIIEDVYFYGLNSSAFDRAINILKRGSLKSIKMGGTSVRGRVSVDDNHRLLFTSIPYDPGWKAYVDSKNVKVEKIAGAFLGVELSPGEHDVIFKFIPRGLVEGIVISIVSFAAAGAILISWPKIKRYLL